MTVEFRTGRLAQGRGFPPGQHVE